MLGLLLAGACSTVPTPVSQDIMPVATPPTPVVASTPAIAYPATRRLDLIEPQFGTGVADPYRWLENDVRNDTEVRDWVAAQNRVTDAFLATLPLREKFKARMTQLYDYERFGVPIRKGGRYFYTRNDGLQNQAVLFVRETADGEGRVLVDPNLWSKDGATALGEWEASEDGKKLLYSIQDGGTDWRTVKVIDVATGTLAPDEVKWVKFSALEWAKDGSGFYYSRGRSTSVPR
jgi:prolyl oligopeptidase